VIPLLLSSALRYGYGAQGRNGVPSVGREGFLNPMSLLWRVGIAIADALKSVAASPAEGWRAVTAGDVTVGVGGVAGSEWTRNGGDHLLLAEAELEEVHAVLRILQSAVWELLHPVPRSGERKDATCISRVEEVLRKY
jgi:hypothetical protein